MIRPNKTTTDNDIASHGIANHQPVRHHRNDRTRHAELTVRFPPFPLYEFAVMRSQALDTEVERFRCRKLDGSYAYVQLDATFVKVRQEHRVVSMAIVIAVGVNQDGQREILGLDVGPSEDGAFWHAFLRSLVARGLPGVKLVTSDAHEGLKAAIASVLQGATGSGAEPIS